MLVMALCSGQVVCFRPPPLNSGVRRFFVAQEKLNMQRTMFWKEFCIALFSALIVFLPQAEAQNPKVSKSGMDLKRLAMIPVRMKSFVEQESIAGAVTLVVRRGQVERV